MFVRVLKNKFWNLWMSQICDYVYCGYFADSKSKHILLSAKITTETFIKPICLYGQNWWNGSPLKVKKKKRSKQLL